MDEFATPTWVQQKFLDMVQTKPTWWHEEAEPVPAEYPAGPLVGTRKQIGSWLYGDHIRDPRRLADKARRRVVWGRKIHKRLYEVWFQDERAFVQAKERKLRDQASGIVRD